MHHHPPAAAALASATAAAIANAVANALASPRAAVPVSGHPPEALLMSAKLIKRLPHLAWKRGKWRFEPAAALRRLGFRGHYLLGPDGAPLDDRAAEDWANTVLLPQIAAARRAPAEEEAKRKKARARVMASLFPRALTVEALFREFFALPKLNGEAVVQGRKVRKPLAAATVRQYQQCRRRFLAQPQFMARTAAAIMPRDVNAVLEEIEAAHGLATARACRALLSAVYAALGARHGFANPVSGAEEMPLPEGRTRPARPHELAHFIATADAMGRPEIADMALFGALYGQRQADRFLLEAGQMVETEAGPRLAVAQRKTGKRLLLKLVPDMQERMAAARERRRAHKVQWPHLFIDEREGAPWNPEGSHYRGVWAEVRAEAARAMPSLADFRDQDLRDTFVSWTRAEGIAFEQRRAASGHSASSAGLEERHYQGQDPNAATPAIEAAANVWRKAQKREGEA